MLGRLPHSFRADCMLNGKQSPAAAAAIYVMPALFWNATFKLFMTTKTKKCFKIRGKYSYFLNTAQHAAQMLNSKRGECHITRHSPQGKSKALWIMVYRSDAYQMMRQISHDMILVVQKIY